MRKQKPFYGQNFAKKNEFDDRNGRNRLLNTSSIKGTLKEHSPDTKKTSGKHSPFARYGALKEHAFGERNTLASLLCFGSKGTQGDGLASAAADLN